MKFALPKKNVPLMATAAVCVLLYVIASVRYDNFFSLQIFINFFANYAFLGIAAIGMTFVILSGGIDLSVGAMIGCCSIMLATLIEQGLHPLPAYGLVLLFGVVFGAMQGALIHFFSQPPFLVTLAGMFMARGLGLVISAESKSIMHPFYDKLYELAIPLGGNTYIPVTALIFLAVFAAGVYLSIYTRFGRNTYAIGGNEQSALLMGLPVGSTKLRIYAFSGFCSALAGIVFTIFMFAGNAIGGTMLELDAIAAVVIGGTLLSGGVGSVFGTLLGVLIYGIIETSIIFEGDLSSWWTRIAIGTLLALFILLQKAVQWKL